MDMKVKKKTSINLNSLVNSHEKPFLVIDKNYRILAVNKAYQQTYATSNNNAVGKYCYQLSHGKDRPCNHDGEECPHEHIFNTGESKTCMQDHRESDDHRHQLKVSAFPLRGSNDELLLGESLEQIESTQEYNPTPTSERIIGKSPRFLVYADQLKIAASSDAPVLLQGETGTGKELAAEYIHSHSSRSHKPLQIVDTTVLSDSLFESEMFGHVSGAYTGSIGAKQGLFEMADGGTLFLDEIGDMPILQQAKLLRVLETGQYRPVGGKATRKANVRIICATNRNLWHAVLAGTFRQDMYYRIACLNIHLPTLQERINDIPVLAHGLLEGINKDMNNKVMGCDYCLTADAVEQLKTYHYPGNIRELRNILVIAATQSKKHEIDATLIERVISNLQPCAPETDRENSINQAVSITRSTTKLDTEINGSTTLKSIEEKHIKELLGRHHGNRKRVADILGISERTIYRKLKHLGIN